MIEPTGSARLSEIWRSLITISFGTPFIPPPDLDKPAFAVIRRARQSNRAQIVRLSLEPAPQSFRQIYDVNELDRLCVTRCMT
jgi:hypothetical protein